jgi:CelD/BcsL family acetyltransferase involved in cellulose biosynthesis
MPLTTATIAAHDEFVALADEWDRLVVTAARPSPFMLHDWLVEWWAHYGSDATLAVSVARRDGVLVAALPLFVHRRRGLRVAEFLGGHHSELADVLLLDQHDDEAARAALKQARAGAYDYVDLFGLPTGSRLADLAEGEMTLIERADAPVLDLGAGWDAVQTAKLSSKRRYAYRRKRKQLAQLGRLEVTLAKTWEEVEPALEEGFRLHALRWDGRPDGTDLQSERGRRFHRAAYRRFAEDDLARIISLTLDGRTIAFHSYFSFCGVLYSDRLAFDPGFARFSPGFLNTLDMLEAAAAEGLHRVEFLGGREEYKLTFADGFEPLCEGFGLARTPQGHAGAAVALGGVRLRRRLRDSPVRRIYFEDLAPLRRRLRRRDTAVAYADR